ncbi:MAG TPA: cyclopropane fatty acyl phospholipid synthase, partial [Deltaproteobacteria bacterium]|nr:cyclopropane fatty acyl phospholipid synthase [Deltaproteobacteria bacterium]
MSKDTIRMLLAGTGVMIDGSDPWDITVHDDRLYGRVLRYKSLGLGEAYMDGWWDCPRVDELMYRLLSARVDARIWGNIANLLRALPAVVLNLQSRRRSPIIVERHYDLDNELFLSFLDPYNQYSCAYFEGTDDLDAAQLNKLDLICRKLGLRREDRVLDIGSGWGGFGRYAAERYGCSVVGVNISREQNAYARRFCKGLPVEIRQCDYRDIEGSFDKVVSVGMFEHVGRKNYRSFMNKVLRVLKQGGVFLLHTIGNNVSRRTRDPWMDRYIFPNGELPS